MSTKKLSNIPYKKFKKFLKSQGLNLITSSKGRGGHEKWSRLDLDRPITLQSHICPVPEFIVKQTLRHLGLSKQQFFNAFDKI